MESMKNMNDFDYKLWKKTYKIILSIGWPWEAPAFRFGGWTTASYDQGGWWGSFGIGLGVLEGGRRWSAGCSRFSVLGGVLDVPAESALHPGSESRPGRALARPLIIMNALEGKGNFMRVRVNIIINYSWCSARVVNRTLCVLKTVRGFAE